MTFTMLLEPVLDKMQQHGVIHVGFQRHTPPFSYASETCEACCASDACVKCNHAFNPVGYSVDLCRRVIAGIARQMRLAEIRICPVEIHSSNRLALLQQGVIDIECGSTTNTVQRQPLSLFSHAIFYTAHRILLKDAEEGRRAPAGQALQHPLMPGLTAGLTPELKITGIENSTSHAALMAWMQADRCMHFIGCPSIACAFERFRQDPQIGAIVADEVILKSLLLQQLRAERTGMHLLPDRLGGERYGFMIRNGDRAFKAAVDAELASVFQSGDFDALYARWFMTALPGLGFNLDLPLSEPMQHLIRCPSDRAA